MVTILPAYFDSPVKIEPSSPVPVCTIPGVRLCTVDEANGGSGNGSSLLSKLFRKRVPAEDQRRKARQKLEGYREALAREGRSVESKLEGFFDEEAATKASCTANLKTIYTFGVLQLLPLCKDRAVYTMRYIRTINEMNLCTVRVLANKIKECMEALELLDLISVPSVVSVPQVLVIEDSFFQSTRDLQANDAPYISAKRELDSIQAEMVVINEKLSASASKLDRRSEAVQNDWMLRVLSEEFASKDECDSEDSESLVLTAIALLREGDGKYMSIRRLSRVRLELGFALSDEEEARVQAIELQLRKRESRQCIFDSLCTDQRTVFGSLLQGWCDRVLTNGSGGYTFGLDVDLDGKDCVPQCTRRRLRDENKVTPGHHRPTASGSTTSSPLPAGRDRFGSLDSVPEYGGDSPPSGRGGAVSNGIASDFPRTASGVSATTGVPSPHKPPLTPSRSVPTISRPSGGEVFAGVSADCVKVDGVDVVDLSVRAPAVEPMIPTPKVLLAFLGHFTQTIATRFGLDKPLLPVLRGFVDRLVYPRIYDLCFHRLRGANVLEKRDARWKSRLPVALRMAPAEIGIDARFLKLLPSELSDLTHNGHADPVAPDSLSDTEVAAKLELCLFARPRQLLQAMERQTVPSRMLSYLVAAMLSALDEVGRRCGDPVAASAMDAETMMPLFVYLFSRSNLKRPHACLAYLANFAITRAAMCGKSGYLLTTAEAAVRWVCQQSVRKRDALPPPNPSPPTAASSGGPATLRHPDLRKDSWTTDESVEYGGGSAMSPPPPLAAASFQTPQRPTVSEATPLREPPKPRRSTMRMDDGISKLLRRQTIARQSMDASTFRQLLEDSALDSPVGAIAGVDEDSDDDYMNEEDMPEKADKVKDEESMRQLREWLGHAELLEATRSVLW